MRDVVPIEAFADNVEEPSSIFLGVTNPESMASSSSKPKKEKALRTYKRKFPKNPKKIYSDTLAKAVRAFVDSVNERRAESERMVDAGAEVVEVQPLAVLAPDADPDYLIWLNYLTEARMILGPNALDEDCNELAAQLAEKASK